MEIQVSGAPRLKFEHSRGDVPDRDCGLWLLRIRIHISEQECDLCMMHTWPCVPPLLCILQWLSIALRTKDSLLNVALLSSPSMGFRRLFTLPLPSCSSELLSVPQGSHASLTCRPARRLLPYSDTLPPLPSTSLLTLGRGRGGETSAPPGSFLTWASWSLTSPRPAPSGALGCCPTFPLQGYEVQGAESVSCAQCPPRLALGRSSSLVE